MACLALLAGCIAQPKLAVQAPTDAELHWALSGEALLGHPVKTLPEEQVMALSDEMHQFLELYVTSGGNRLKSAKFNSLLRAIFHNGILGLQYDPLTTHTAAETFYFQEGNCLSFTSMFVALAREAGLKAYFNEVQVPPTWDMQSPGTHVYYRHINAVVELPRGRKIVDLNRENYNVDYPQGKVDDSYAEAQFYNNRAMEKLFEQDLKQAFRYQRKALQLAPKLEFLWANFGTIYRRAGHFDEAEVAYRRALELSPRNLLVISNLGRLYRQLERTEEAQQFESMAHRFRMNNPYFRYHLAEEALEQRQFVQASAHIEAAIDSYNEDHRFFFLAARVDSALGRSASARKNLERAVSLTKDAGQQSRYRNKLEMLFAAKP
jgi:Tfp pilus assembly protein PilF